MEAAIADARRPRRPQQAPHRVARLPLGPDGPDARRVRADCRRGPLPGTADSDRLERQRADRVRRRDLESAVLAPARPRGGAVRGRHGRAARERVRRVPRDRARRRSCLAWAASADSDSAAVWLPSLRKGRSDWEQMLESLARSTCAAPTSTGGASTRTTAAARWRCRPIRSSASATGFLAPTRRRNRGGAAVPFERDCGRPALGPPTARRSISASTRYPAKWECLERLTTVYVIQAFHDLGAFAPRRRATDRR